MVPFIRSGNFERGRDFPEWKWKRKRNSTFWRKIAVRNLWVSGTQALQNKVALPFFSVSFKIAEWEILQLSFTPKHNYIWYLRNIEQSDAKRRTGDSQRFRSAWFKKPFRLNCLYFLMINMRTLVHQRIREQNKQYNENYSAKRKYGTEHKFSLFQHLRSGSSSVFNNAV